MEGGESLLPSSGSFCPLKGIRGGAGGRRGARGRGEGWALMKSLLGPQDYFFSFAQKRSLNQAPLRFPILSVSALGSTLQCLVVVGT